MSVLRSLLESELQSFAADPERAQQLITIGLSEPAADVKPVELAAWTSVARAILNMHEIVTRN